MRTALKLNFVSIIYAVFMFGVLELMTNVIRLQRLTDSVIDGKKICLAILFVIPIFFLLMLCFTRKYFGTSRLRYLTAVIWLLFTPVMIKFFSTIFPKSPQDQENNVVGLFVLTSLTVYPIFIFLVNFFAGLLCDNIDKDGNEKI